MPKAVDMPKRIEAVLKVVEEMKPQTAAQPIPEAPSAPAPVAVAAANAAAGTRSNRFALLAASVALASAIGAMVGALAATTMMRSAPVAAAAASEGNSMQNAIAALHADLATLKTNVEATNRKVTERLERVDRVQALPAAQLKQFLEAVERLERRAQSAPDVTGSTKAQQVAAVPPVPPVPPVQAEAPRPTVLEGWVVRHVSRGVAVIQGRRGGIIEVETGDIVPGVGRIESIRRQDGRWVVITSKGMIMSALGPGVLPPGAIPMPR
jgi:hypothetical protein